MFVRACLYLVLAALAVLPTIAQNQPQLTARELFYTIVSNPPQAGRVPAPPAGSSGGAVKNQANEGRTPPLTATNPNRNSQPVPPAGPPPGARRPAELVPVQAAEVRPLGLRYSVLHRNASGAYAEVDADMVFGTGDRIRVNVQPNADGYLYVLNRGTSGRWNLLLPSEGQPAGRNFMRAFETYLIPGEGQWRFEENPGAERLFIVLARQPLEDIESLIYSLNEGVPNSRPAQTPTVQSVQNLSIDDNVVNGIRNSFAARDLVFEQVVDDPTPRKEKAVYVVNPTTNADSRVVVELTLTHR